MLVHCIFMYLIYTPDAMYVDIGVHAYMNINLINLHARYLHRHYITTTLRLWSYIHI